MGGLRQRAITRVLPYLGAVALLGALTWPLLFTYSGFAGDWPHHLWLLWHQSRSIESSGFPSFFVHSAYSVFNPIFAFYGGTLYALGGVLSLALGNAPVQAYVLICLLDFVAAFGGWYWMGRMAGLGRLAAAVPGLIFITSAYYVTLIYVRGDWPEFTGTSMIPLMVAAGLSVLRADRLRYGPAVVLVLSSIVFFGSHVLTTLLGGTTLVLTGLLVLACVPQARRLLTRRGVLRAAGLMVPSALVSAWYLLPMVLYKSRTNIGGGFEQVQETVRSNAGLVSAAHLFTFSRASVIPEPVPGPYHGYAFALSLPVLAIAWVLVGGFVLPWGNRNRVWVRLLSISMVMAVLVGLTMTHVGILLALPRPFAFVQFSYRLETYVLLELCAAVLAALVLVKSGSRAARPWKWIVIPVCLVSLVAAIQQIRAYPYPGDPFPGQDRYATVREYGSVSIGNSTDYHDGSQQRVLPEGLPTLEFPFESVSEDSVSASTSLAPGKLVTTNIAAGPYLLHITGAEPVGVDVLSQNMVLRIDSSTVTVSTGEGLPILLGRLLSLLAGACLALQLLFVPGGRLLLRLARSGRTAERDPERQPV